MAFQPKDKSTGSLNKSNQDAHGQDQFSHLVDQITEAVRNRLVTQGVPLPDRTNSLDSRTPEASVLRAIPSQPEWQRVLNSGADRIGHTGDAPLKHDPSATDRELAAKIDHTLLKPDATPQEIERVALEAKKYGFATVCVNSAYVGRVAELLKGTDVKAIAVVGFPLGAASMTSKAYEAKEAINSGAKEIDMVINIGALKGKDYAYVLEDIARVVDASKPYPVKVILETSNLNHDEKIIACALSKAAGAAFVKTSTGFASGGATAEDIELMRRVVGPEMGVKASGGIRTYEDAAKMIAAGASRIGASASVSIVKHETSATNKTHSEKDVAKKPPKNSLY